MLAFDSDNLSSNPAEFYCFYSLMKINVKEAWDGI